MFNAQLEANLKGIDTIWLVAQNQKWVSIKHDETILRKPLLITTLVTGVSRHFECF